MDMKSDSGKADSIKGAYLNAEQLMVDETAKEKYEEMAVNIDGTMSFLIELEQDSYGNR